MQYVAPHETFAGLYIINWLIFINLATKFLFMNPTSRTMIFRDVIHPQVHVSLSSKRV